MGVLGEYVERYIRTGRIRWYPSCVMGDHADILSALELAKKPFHATVPLKAGFRIRNRIHIGSVLTEFLNPNTEHESGLRFTKKPTVLKSLQNTFLNSSCLYFFIIIRQKILQYFTVLKNLKGQSKKCFQKIKPWIQNPNLGSRI